MGRIHVEHDVEIGPVVIERGVEHLVRHALELDLDFRVMLLQIRRELQDERARRIVQVAQAHHGLSAFVEARHLGKGGVVFGKDGLRSVEENGARVSDGDRLLRADEEFGAELVFHSRNMAADNRRAHEEMARSIAEAQVLGEVFEFTQMLDVHVPAFLHLERCRLLKRPVRQRIAESAPPPPERKHERESPSDSGR